MNDNSSTGSNPIALEQRQTLDDGRLFSPSAARNSSVVVEGWKDIGPKTGRVLEIGSGTGEHAIAIMAAHSELSWIASDLDKRSRMSQAAWAKHAGFEHRFEGPLVIDAAIPASEWGVEPGLAGMFCANMLHISPWEAGRGVISGAGALLSPSGRIVLYGPYRRNGEHTAPSNAEFDVSLKTRNPEWGIRDLESEVLPLANDVGLSLVEVRPVPANNFIVVLQKN